MEAKEIYESKINKVKERQLKDYISGKVNAKEEYQKLWQRIVELDEIIGLETSTFKELQSKISSRIAQYDISIQDHKKLLPKIDCHCKTDEDRHDCYANCNYGG